MPSCFGDSAFEKEVVMYLDYCKDGLLDQMKKLYEEKERTPVQKKQLLLAKDKHEERNCLHIVGRLFFTNY